MKNNKSKIHEFPTLGSIFKANFNRKERSFFMLSQYNNKSKLVVKKSLYNLNLTKWNSLYTEQEYHKYSKSI